MILKHPWEIVMANKKAQDGPNVDDDSTWLGECTYSKTFYTIIGEACMANISDANMKNFD